MNESQPAPQNFESDEVARLKVELAATREELDRVKRSREILIHRINQEFRIPLNTMVGFGQLLQGAMKENQENLEQVLEAGGQMLGLLDALMAGLTPPKPAPCPQPDRAPGSQRALTVLYIEDHEENVLTVGLLLRQRPGTTLISAPDGETGIAMAREQNPDLVLLDLNLPDMHGSDVLGRLRGSPETSGIPVVVLSADAAPSQIDRLLAAGAQNYLVKPFQMKRLIHVIDEIFADGDVTTVC